MKEPLRGHLLMTVSATDLIDLMKSHPLIWVAFSFLGKTTIYW